MKMVISFAIAGLYVSIKQLKPFNPLLGETFQGEFEDGSKMFAEHISYHPTISTFYLKGNKDSYNLSAFFDFSTASENLGSILKVYQKGPITINFNKLGKEKIQYCMPSIKLLNANSENDRASLWIEEMIFVDVKNNLKAIIKFAKDKNCIHEFKGIIINNIFHQNYNFNVEKINTEKHLIDKFNKISPLTNIKR